MSTTLTQPTQGSFQVAFRPAGPTPDPEAWKKLMGQKPVPARLATLPESKLRWSALLTSTLFQAAVAVVLVAIPMFFPDRLVTKIEYEVTPLATPDTSVPLPKRAPPVVQAKVQPAPKPVEAPPPPQHVAKLLMPKELAPPKPKPVEVKNQDVPQINQALQEAKLDMTDAEPARPRDPVKVGGLASTGSAAAPTIESRPLDQVQTGGFGDPHGVVGPSNPNKRANIGQFGSTDLPPGPGYGNGTGGANGVRGTVASTGFGNGVAIPPPASSGPRGTVKAGGFAAEDLSSEAPKAKQAESTAAVQPVVILEKPKPIYSDEARKLGLEGEVLVEVVFPASGGPVQVGRVTKGLGHGLDEAAMRAAQQIRFKPALQDGKPVDFPAVVHIVFQLAY
jgi:TonB family protein